MKWPLELWWFRHGVSEYNDLRNRKKTDPWYRKFTDLYETDCESEGTRELALQLWKKYALNCGDWNTPLTFEGRAQSRLAGTRMSEYVQLPDVIFTSPYDRPKQTLKAVIEGWPELGSVRQVVDYRLHEQDHGLATLYNDWRIFNVLHPEQKLYREQAGPFWYRYPQGQNVPDVIESIRSFIGTLTRDYSEQKVGVFSHHLTILAFMAAIHRWSPEEFIDWDENRKPINSGLTIYRGNPDVGENGKLELVQYNLKLY